MSSPKESKIKITPIRNSPEELLSTNYTTSDDPLPEDPIFREMYESLRDHIRELRNPPGSTNTEDEE